MSSELEFAYLDSSVILRVILDEPAQLKEFRQVKQGVSSQITKLECMRTLDRLRHSASATDMEFAELFTIFHKIYMKLILVPVSHSMIDRASQPVGFALKSLDALHLASCQAFQIAHNCRLPLLTHNNKLGFVARAVGIDVMGV